MSEEKKPEKYQAIIRRLFRNTNGDWKKAEGLCKEIMIWSTTVESLANDLAKADKKLKELCLQAYEITPKKDSLFYDSPISPSKVSMYLRSHLKKAGMEWIRDVHQSDIEINPITKMMKDATRWLLKFKDETDDEKTA